MDAKALVFGTNEDGADDVAGDEEKKKAVMHLWVPEGVKYGKEN